MKQRISVACNNLVKQNLTRMNSRIFLNVNKNMGQTIRNTQPIKTPKLIEKEGKSIRLKKI